MAHKASVPKRRNFPTLNKLVLKNDKACSSILASCREVIMICLSFQNFLDKNFVTECQNDKFARVKKAIRNRMGFDSQRETRSMGI